MCHRNKDFNDVPTCAHLDCSCNNLQQTERSWPFCGNVGRPGVSWVNLVLTRAKVRTQWTWPLPVSDLTTVTFTTIKITAHLSVNSPLVWLAEGESFISNRHNNKHSVFNAKIIRHRFRFHRADANRQVTKSISLFIIYFKKINQRLFWKLINHLSHVSCQKCLKPFHGLSIWNVTICCFYCLKLQ